MDILGQDVEFDLTLAGGFAQEPNREQIVAENSEERAKAQPKQSRSESRASRLSNVERRIVKKPNICEACRLNDDPRKVPVHPNCDCDVITDSIESGVADPTSRFLQPLSRANMDLEVITGDELHGDLVFDPETVAIMEEENVRFSDIARWLEAMQPYLDRADRVYDYISIAVDDDTDEAVQQVQDTLEALSEDTESFAEAIKSRKLWFALAKAVAF